VPLRLSLSEKPSQFSVELPIGVKVSIHESSHHVSRQRGYLLTITTRMNLDTLPGTVTPSRRSVLHRARPVEQPRHGIVSGNNDAAARGIAAAILRRYRSALFRIPPRRVVAGQRPRKLRWPIALTRRALRGSPARFFDSPLSPLQRTCNRRQRGSYAHPRSCSRRRTGYPRPGPIVPACDTLPIQKRSSRSST